METYNKFYDWTASNDKYANCDIIEDAVSLACKINDVASISHLIPNYENMLFLVDFDNTFYFVCENNYIDIVIIFLSYDYLILPRVTKYKRCAIENNNMLLLQLLQQKWPDESNQAFSIACERNEIEMAKYLREFVNKDHNVRLLINTLLNLQLFDMANWLSIEFNICIDVRQIQHVLFISQKQITMKHLHVILKYWRNLISESDANKLFQKACDDINIDKAFVLKSVFPNIDVKNNNRVIIEADTRISEAKYKFIQWLLSFYNLSDLPRVINMLFFHTEPSLLLLKYIIQEFNISEMIISARYQQQFNDLILQQSEKSNHLKTKSANKI